MTSITISIPDDQMAQLTAIARRLKLSPEELARVGVQELLNRPEDAFQQTVEKVIQSNAELYRRLA